MKSVELGIAIGFIQGALLVFVIVLIAKWFGWVY